MPIIPIPFVTSIYTSVSSNGFTYRNAIKNDPNIDTAAYIDLETIAKKVKKKNYIFEKTCIDLVQFGFKINHTQYINFNISEVFNGRVTYPGDLVNLLYKGNYQFLGQTANFDGMGIDMIHYREIGVGYTNNFDDKWTVGGRFKFLFGMANVWTQKSEISLQTEEQYYNLTANSNILIHTSLPDKIYNKIENGDTSEFTMNEAMNYAFNMKNLGAGLDLGASYKINDDFGVSASLNDLAFIVFKSPVRNYVSKPGTFTFDGLDAKAIFSKSDSVRQSALSKIADTLLKIFDVDSTFDKYTYFLNPSMYINGYYNIDKKRQVHVTGKFEIWEKALHPSFSIAYFEKVNKAFSFSVNYAYMNRSWLNFGLAGAIRFGPIQLWLSTENFMAAIVPQLVKNASIHVGCNWIFYYKNYRPLMGD